MGMDIFSVLGGSPSGNALIPNRDPGAITGSVFIQENMHLTGASRESNILHEFLAGNVPNFLRDFVGVELTVGSDTITYLVMADYLALGTDADYVRMPMNPHTAQAIADKYDCTLPTRKMVNDIWKLSVNKVAPLPWGPPYDATMMSTDRIGIHNGRIQEQLAGKDFKALLSGHKKDVVLTNKLYPSNPNKRVAIYGWIQLNGQAIQGLNPSSHEDTYADYSHGIRMIANDVIVNGNPMRMKDVFADPKLCALVSDEGVLKFTSY
jgi:hypothetical protein